jgi:murein DD-endopeptidase MepM/ murein hydrolase activator NlpD
MIVSGARWEWVRRVCLVAAALGLSACATVVPATPVAVATPHDDEDLSQLIAQLRADLNRSNKREAARQPAPATAASQVARDTAFADKARALFAPLAALRMPVVGIRVRDLYNSWGDPRDGGRRAHRGIDIFAPRGTPIVAVTDGIISYIGDQPKGGHCLWLTTESGTSFYYAHLDRWAPGIYEGMEVLSGDLLGFVGNTGNAQTTPPHLHFAVNQNDEMVNPFPILTKALPVRQAQTRSPLGSGYGTR